MWFFISQKKESHQKASDKDSEPSANISSNNDPTAVKTKSLDQSIPHTEPASEPQIRQLANSIESYKQLPEPDKNWVLENTVYSLKAGALTEENVQLYITQLSSLRMHTVLERQEPYIDSVAEPTHQDFEETL